MLSRMWKRYAFGFDRLEGIDRIPRRGGTDMGFQSLAVDHVNAAVEQARDMALQTHIVVNRHGGFRCWVDVDHDIGVAVGAVIAARARTEQGGMRDAACAQVALVLAKPVKDLLPVHTVPHTTKGARNRRADGIGAPIRKQAPYPSLRVPHRPPAGPLG